MDKKEAKDFAVKAARFIDSKKAEDVKVYDLNGLSSLCDYIVIGTANSTPHLESLDQDSGTELKQYGVYKNNRDGGQTSTWRVSDYGAFMLHIMTNAAREFYALDKIYSFAKEVKWQQPAPKKAKPATKKTTAKAGKRTAAKKTKTVKTAKKTVKKTATAKKVTDKTDKTAKTAKTVKKTAAKTTKKTAKKAVKKTAKKSTK